MLKPEAILRYT